MELPSWFHSALQRRLDQVAVSIGKLPEIRKARTEEYKAFKALFAGKDPVQLPGFMEWEDRHHFNRALENERFYQQGMRDGAQLIFALLTEAGAPNEKA